MDRTISLCVFFIFLYFFFHPSFSLLFFCHRCCGFASDGGVVVADPVEAERRIGHLPMMSGLGRRRRFFLYFSFGDRWPDCHLWETAEKRTPSWLPKPGDDDIDWSAPFSKKDSDGVAWGVGVGKNRRPASLLSSSTATSAAGGRLGGLCWFSRRLYWRFFFHFVLFRFVLASSFYFLISVLGRPRIET